MALPSLFRNFKVGCLLRRSLFLPKRPYSGYVVLIPEIGEDLPNKNPFIRPDGLPDFKNVTLENCSAKIGQQSAEVERTVKEAEQYLAANESITIDDFFENVVNPLERVETELETSWGLAKTLYFSDATLMPPKKYVVLHQRANRAHTAKFHSVEIYKHACALKDKYSTKNELTPIQDRLLTKFVLEGKLNGLALNESERAILHVNLIKLKNEQITYQSKVNVAIDKFSHVITDYTDVRLFPTEVLRVMSEDPKNYLLGPWKLTLKPKIYDPFMKYCPDRMLRWNLWQSNTRKASKVTHRELDNGIHILNLREYCRNAAQQLGFKNYMEMKMQTKMVGSIENVQEFIRILLLDARDAQQVELRRLSDFAYKNGFPSRFIEEHDVAYWKQQYASTVCRYDQNLIQEYFPLTKVLSGMFDLCEKLFNIKVIERVEGVSTWDERVRFFEVFDLNKSSLTTDSSKPIAGIYFDLFSRNHQYSDGFTNTIRDKCTLTNSNPLASLILNLETPLYGKPCLLPFNKAKALFSKFGQTLRTMLTEVNNRELAGNTNIEWDAVEVCEKVFSNLFYDPEVLKSMSEHVTTKECLSDNLIQTIHDKRLNLAGYNLCNELFKSDLDLQLYSTDVFWLDIVRRLWPEYYMFELDKNDARVCSMLDIFVGTWSAGYYSHVWADMMAADIYHAFNDTKNEKNPAEALQEVGQRFRNNFLALGDSRHPSEVFRNFRGRDPSPQALLSLLGLLPERSTIKPSDKMENVK